MFQDVSILKEIKILERHAHRALRFILREHLGVFPGYHRINERSYFLMVSTFPQTDQHQVHRIDEL